MLGWGNFLTIVFNFAIIAWVMFLVAKPMNHLKRSAAKKPAKGRRRRGKR